MEEELKQIDNALVDKLKNNIFNIITNDYINASVTFCNTFVEHINTLLENKDFNNITTVAVINNENNKIDFSITFKLNYLKRIVAEAEGLNNRLKNVEEDELFTMLHTLTDFVFTKKDETVKMEFLINSYA